MSAPMNLPPDILEMILGGGNPAMGPLGPAPAPPAPMDMLAGMPPLPPDAPQFPGIMPPPPPPPTPTMDQFGVMPVDGIMPLEGDFFDPADGYDPDDKPTKPDREKPDMDTIRDLSEQAVEFWAPRDARMREDWNLYKLTAPSAGDGSVVTKATPYAAVEKAANMIASQTPNIQVIPPSNLQAEEAQKVEEFLRWSNERWNKRWRRSQMQGSMRHSMAHYLCLRGWVTARMQYMGDAEDVNKNYRHHPIHVKLFDPIQVYPSPGDDGLRYVVHRYYTTYGELWDEWEEAKDEYGDENPTDIVEITTYYDDWYYAVMVGEDTLIDVTEHEYGFVPWVIVTGNGSPVRATEDNQTSWVADVGVSIFHGSKDAYRSLNKVLSQLATQVETAANPPTIYYYDPVMNANPQPVDMAPGATNYMFYDRERLDPINLSPRPTDVAPLIDSLQDDLDRTTLPSIVWGLGGTESGFQTSILTDAARDSLYPIISAMQEVQEQINETALILLRDHHDEAVGFWIKNPDGTKAGGVTLSPEEIKAVGVENEVRYRDISPKDRATMAQLAMGLTNAKLISMETARDEYLNLENPSRENKRVLTDMVYLDEDVMKNGIIPQNLMEENPELYQLYMQHRAQPQPPPMAPGMDAGGGVPPPPQPGGPPVPGMEGLPPGVVPPVAQPGADLLLQSLGSSLGGANAGPPPGVSGVPLGLPIGL